MWWTLVALLIAARVLISLAVKGFRKSDGLRSSLLLVLGSGGHTAELLALLHAFDLSIFTPRHYIVADTDKMSAMKAQRFEQQQDIHYKHHKPVKSNPSSLEPNQQPNYTIKTIPRSREVGQSFSTSIPTTLTAILYALVAVFRIRPDIVLVNGPGTCIPVCIGALCVRILGLAKGRVVYVESIARVRRLSLSGRLLYHLRMTDMFFVQWEDLIDVYPRAMYKGRLM